MMDERIYEKIEKAESLRLKSKYREALAVFKDACLLAKRRNDPGGLLDATMAVADVSRIMGDFDTAIEFYTESLEICEGLCNDLTAADAMVGLGLSYRAVGMWQKAMRLIGRARQVYTRADDKKGLAFALWAEAGSLRVAGKIPAAINAFKEARKVFSSVKYDSGIAYCFAGLGGAHRIAGKFADSNKYYQRANEMFRAQKDIFGMAYTHCGIGNAHRMSGDFAGALLHFKKATDLYSKIGDIVSFSYTLWSLACVYKMKGDLDKAANCIASARKNFKKTKDPRGIVYCDLADGEAAWIKGDRKLARKLIQSALDSSRKHKFRLEECHSKLLLLNSSHPFSSGVAAATVTCYKKIGIDPKLSTAPFNIP
ncbi:MAG TPA: tetratricopeptide repeat protein [Dissulfurispiraceae bacterium]|nr:tetratricopeptide repeat protein [Dissulfurispiraceae bacterium]